MFILLNKVSLDIQNEASCILCFLMAQDILQDYNYYKLLLYSQGNTLTSPVVKLHFHKSLLITCDGCKILLNITTL